MPILLRLDARFSAQRRLYRRYSTGHINVIPTCFTVDISYVLGKVSCLVGSLSHLLSGGYSESQASVHSTFEDAQRAVNRPE